MHDATNLEFFSLSGQLRRMDSAAEGDAGRGERRMTTLM